MNSTIVRENSPRSTKGAMDFIFFGSTSSEKPKAELMLLLDLQRILDLDP